MFKPVLECVAKTARLLDRCARCAPEETCTGTWRLRKSLIRFSCHPASSGSAWAVSPGNAQASSSVGQIRHKVKTTRINRKAAGKSQATSMHEHRVMKHMANRIQQKMTYVDTPPFLIGYHDRIHQDMPWDMWGQMLWLLGQKQRRLDMIEEGVRAQAVIDELANKHGQDSARAQEHGQNLYVQIKQQLACGTVPQSLMTRECREALSHEIGSLAKGGCRLVDWNTKPGLRSRILQRRVLPDPQTQKTFFQITLQMKSAEVQTVQTASGLKEISLAYEPIWVLAKSVDTSPETDQPVPSGQFGGWKLCARLHDHEVGGKSVGSRREVASMIPDTLMQAQLQRVWEVSKFCIASDRVTWPSWLIRWALEIRTEK
eukprot:jgi/Ulvmu1/2719/UM014_0176.1